MGSQNIDWHCGSACESWFIEISTVEPHEEPSARVLQMYPLEQIWQKRKTKILSELFTINISFSSRNPCLMLDHYSLECFHPHFQFSHRAVVPTSSVLLQNCYSEIQSQSCVLQIYYGCKLLNMIQYVMSKDFTSQRDEEILPKRRK